MRVANPEVSKDKKKNPGAVWPAGFVKLLKKDTSWISIEIQGRNLTEHRTYPQPFGKLSMWCAFRCLMKLTNVNSLKCNNLPGT